MSKKKHKATESIIKDYNNKLNHDINYNDGSNIIHSKGSIYTYSKSRKHKKCKYCNNAGTCKSPFSLNKGSLCKGANCPSYIKS